jgi:nucleolar complex protein 2
MGNCIVELYTLDYASAYQHAFIYIRQLALHLRTALMKHTPESMAVVYCWQYIHCLKLWVAVLSASQKKNDSIDESSSKLGGGAGKDEEANLLRSLVYPLTEIILGVCRLVPITRYVPLRLHCVRLLQQLAASTESFIPTTSLLLGILELKEISMKPLRQGGGKGGGKKKKDDVRGLRLPLILKLPKEGTLRTMEQLDAVLKETFVLLNREVDLYRYSPGFPEFTFTILQRLRKVSGKDMLLRF